MRRQNENCEGDSEMGGRAQGATGMRDQVHDGLDGTYKWKKRTRALRLGIGLLAGMRG